MKTVLFLLASIISVALLSGLLTACSSGLTDANSGSEKVLAAPPSNNQQQISPCGSMLPIKDRSKLKQSLLDRGRIKEEMSPEEADRVIAQYINKRQQAFEHCPKMRS